MDSFSSSLRRGPVSPPTQPSDHAQAVRMRTERGIRLFPSERVRFAPWETVVRQGEVGDRAWLIVNGALDVTIRTEEQTQRIATIGPWWLVGEMSLIDNGTRTATVRAIRSVEAIPIHRDTLESAFDHSPKVIRYLLETLIATLRRVYGLPSWERNEGSAGFRSVESASGILQRRVFSEGHVFFREWETASFVYLIQSGSVRIERGEKRDTSKIGPGRIFWELAVLTAKPRAATVTAAEQTVCEIISSDTLKDLLRQTPKILRVLIYAYARSIVRINEQYGSKEE